MCGAHKMNIYIYKYTRYVCSKMNSWFVVATLFGIWCLYMLALKWYLSRYLLETLNPNPVKVRINSSATTREKTVVKRNSCLKLSMGVAGDDDGFLISCAGNYGLGVPRFLPSNCHTLN